MKHATFWMVCAILLTVVLLDGHKSIVKPTVKPMLSAPTGSFSNEQLVQWCEQTANNSFRLSQSDVDRIIHRDGSDLPPTQLNLNDYLSKIGALNGHQFAYSSSKRHDIVVFDTINKSFHDITEPPAADGYDLLPSWSTDGKRIVFDRITSHDAKITLMNADGTHVVPLTDTQSDMAYGLNPQFTADGQQIVFERQKVLTAESYAVDDTLWAINTDGTGLRQLPISQQPSHMIESFAVSPATASVAIMVEEGEPHVAVHWDFGSPIAYPPMNNTYLYALSLSGGPAKEVQTIPSYFNFVSRMQWTHDGILVGYHLTPIETGATAGNFLAGLADGGTMKCGQSHVG